MNVDWTKPIQTKGGRKARLLGELKTSSVEYESRVVAVEGAGGYEGLYTYFENGNYFFHEKDHRDIINVPPRKVMREVEAWAVVDKNGTAVSLSCADPTPLTGARVVRLTGTYEVEVE